MCVFKVFFLMIINACQSAPSVEPKGYQGELSIQTPFNNPNYYDFDENKSYEGRHNLCINFRRSYLFHSKLKNRFLVFKDSKELTDDFNDEESEENLHYKDRLSSIQDYYRRMSRAKAFSAWAGKRSQAHDQNDEELLRYLILLNNMPSKKAFSAWAGK